MRDSFVYKKEWMEALWVLPKQVKGEVNEAIVRYGIAEELIPLKALAGAVFSLIKADIDRDREEEERRSAVSEQNRRNVMCRWDAGKEANLDNEANQDNAEDTEIRNGYDRNTTVYTSVIRPQYDRNTAVQGAHANNNNIKNKEDIYINENNNIKEEKNFLRKEESQGDKKAPLEEREAAFKASLEPYRGKYGDMMIGKFFYYWSDTSTYRGKPVMRFEKEKSWCLAKRLAYWNLNNLERKGGRQNDTGTGNDKRRGTEATAAEPEEY